MIVLLIEGLALIVEKPVGISVPSDHLDLYAELPILYQLVCFFLNIKLVSVILYYIATRPYKAF